MKLKSALRHNGLPASVLLVVLPVVSWIWILVMGLDMYRPMTGASVWLMTPVWDAPHLALLWTMWAVMMAGMMLPFVSSLFLLYGSVARRSVNATSVTSRQTYVLAAGYLIVWATFSLGATALQRVLSARMLVSPMMQVTSPLAGAVLLLIAGVYQLTPLKLACLRTCQSPMGFLTSRWRAGTAGAFRMGVERGVICVGCCWALMLLLFAGGVMNLAVIAALTAFVAFEKLTPFGAHSARISGVLLMAAALWMLVQH